MQQEHPLVQNTVVNEEYRLGALSYRRASSDIANPYQPHSAPFQSWQEGYLNEQRCLHIVDGVDIVSSNYEGPISLSIPSSLQRQPRRTYLTYAHELMIATGMYRRAAAKFKEKPFITALQLRNALAAEGDFLSANLANLIKERIKLDSKMKGAVLTEDEVQTVEQASSAARILLLAIGRTQDCYYDRLVRNDVIARLFRKPPEWTAKMLLCSVKRGGLSSSVQFSRQTCTLTPKGWSAASLIQRARIGASANNNDARDENVDDGFAAETSAFRP